MAEKTIKSRLQMKNDTEANWKKAVNFVPKAGELIIYNIDDEHRAQRIKVGNGEDNVNDLPFVEQDLDLAAVATSGSYYDLIDPPAIGGLMTLNLTIPTEGWSDSSPAELFIKQNEMKQFNEPIVDVVLTGDKEQDEAINKAWFNITRMTTTNNGLRVYANQKPEIEIPIHLKEISSTPGGGEGGGGSSGGTGDGIQKEILDHIPIPSEMDENTIYFVPVQDDESKTLYDIYVLINGKCCSLASRAW